VKVKLAYSKDEELKPLLPLLNGRINKRGYDFEVIKIKEDEIKFNLNNFDLLFIPLPVLTLVKDIKILTNGSNVTEKLFIKRIKEDKMLKLLVSGTNSTEFYLAKILINSNIMPAFSDYNSVINYNDGDLDLYKEWVKYCGKVPIVLSVLGSVRLSDGELLKLKVIIRDSASLMVNEGEVESTSKELGLKGREAIECFFKLCREKGLCNEVKLSLL